MQSKKKVKFLPMAIPSKMLWTERAMTMTKLLMEDKSFFSLAFAFKEDFPTFCFVFSASTGDAISDAFEWSLCTWL
jgi:hypothetical protein